MTRPLPELTEFDHAVLKRLIEKGVPYSYSAPSNDWLGIEASVLTPASYERKNHDDRMQDSSEVRKSLERLVRHGLAVKTYQEPSGHRARGRYGFKSQKVVDDIAREVALTPEERAARFIANFREHYVERQRGRGDRADLWPQPAERWGDGLKPALEMGLVVNTGRISSSDHKDGYVPAEFHDAYVEALELQRQREAQIKARHEDLALRLGKFTDIYRASSVTVELTYAQVEALLKHLETSS